MTAVAWWAPGRVNLIGEHTDYSGGFVLPLAVPLGTQVRAASRDDGLLQCHSSRSPDVAAVPVAELAPGRSGWSAYVEGCAWVLAAAGVRLTGADVAVSGDLPVGAGLSSSASLVCATLSALLGLAGEQWEPQAVALAAQRVENEYIGAPVGAMDQMAVMHARAGHALFVDTRSLRFEHLPLDLAGQGLALLVVDTGTPHATAAAGYAERVEQCATAERALGVRQLRDIGDTARLQGLVDPVLRARARHVVTENARVLAATQLLRQGRVSDLGPLLLASHASLRDDFAVSTPLLDTVVDRAMAAGALGARLTGAGFGGSVLVLADEPAAPAVTAAVSAGAERPLVVRRVTPSAGAHPTR